MRTGWIVFTFVSFAASAGEIHIASTGRAEAPADYVVIGVTVNGFGANDPNSNMPYGAAALQQFIQQCRTTWAPGKSFSKSRMLRMSASRKR